MSQFLTMDFQGQGRDPQLLGAQSLAKIRMSPQESVVVTAYEPNRYELARLGRLWVCSPGVKANWVAAVQDDPGTAHAYALYNPSSSQKVLSVLAASARSDAGGTALAGALVVATPQSEATAIVANSTGVLIGNCNGSTRTAPFFYSTSGSLDTAGMWIPVAVSPAPAAAQQAALGYVANHLDGQFLVRPGHKLGVHVESGATAKFGIALLVAELDLPASLPQ